MGAIRTARSGISLIEVLISIGVLALGLLGVAALFPVGSYYMLQAEVKDRSASVAQQAFTDLVDRGMLNPESWLGDDGSANYSQPFAKQCRNAYQEIAPAGEKNQIVSHRGGYAVVLDPLAIASGVEDLNRNGPSASIDWQPYHLMRCPMHYAHRFDSLMWKHFTPSNVGAGARQLPIRRVTLPNRLAVLPMPFATAEKLFMSLEDTVVELPDDRSVPGQARWQAGGVARDFQGDYSWIATVTPTTIQARNSMFQQPSEQLFDVSVVVFYKRLLGSIEVLGKNEVAVAGSVQITGTNGGELILSNENGITKASQPYANLKTGQYVMVTGPHPESTMSEPLLFLQWYRVIAVDSKDLPDYQRRVALKGPDWPWKPNADPSNISNDLRVGIFPGAVAVHTKTMRLSGNSPGSPWAQQPTVPPGTPPIWKPF